MKICQQPNKAISRILVKSIWHLSHWDQEAVVEAHSSYRHHLQY